MTLDLDDIKASWSQNFETEKETVNYQIILHIAAERYKIEIKILVNNGHKKEIVS